jgi:molecular chaperone GrpE
VSKENKASSTSSLHQKFGKEHTEHDSIIDDEQPAAEELLDHASYQELQKQLTQAEELANSYKDSMLRTQADMKNMQRRVELDMANAHKFALEKFALELLPVVDNLERAITAHINDESGAGSLLDGVSLTLKMLIKAMEKFGIESIDPEGQPFNPEFHQAVSTQANSSVAPNTVLSVLQKGYLLNKRLIRPALVVVAK